MQDDHAQGANAPTTPRIDPSKCPLCGEDNHCGARLGQTTCWCFTTPIPADVLARVPDTHRGVACVCQRCATRATTPNE